MKNKCYDWHGLRIQWDNQHIYKSNPSHQTLSQITVMWDPKCLATMLNFWWENHFFSWSCPTCLCNFASLHGISSSTTMVNSYRERRTSHCEFWCCPWYSVPLGIIQPWLDGFGHTKAEKLLPTPLEEFTNSTYYVCLKSRVGVRHKGKIQRLPFWPSKGVIFGSSVPFYHTYKRNSCVNNVLCWSLPIDSLVLLRLWYLVSQTLFVKSLNRMPRGPQSDVCLLPIWYY